MTLCIIFYYIFYLNKIFYLMKSFSLIKKKNIFLLSLASVGLGYSLMDTDSYYLLIGLRRGTRSITTGIKIISNYYFVSRILI